MMDNADRAGRVFDTLAQYGEEETAVIDLLTDLMHHCHIAGTDFPNDLRIAEGHFQEEIS
jgi:hypothetical protein